MTVKGQALFEKLDVLCFFGKLVFDFDAFAGDQCGLFGISFDETTKV